MGTLECILVCVLVFEQCVSVEINQESIQKLFPYLRNYTVITSPCLQISNNFIRIDIAASAFGKNINLILEKESADTFPMTSLTVNGEILPKSQSEKVMKESLLLKGYDKYFPDSSFAFGKMCGNNYDGFVSYKKELYFIEPLEKYLFISNKSIVYRKSDMDEGYFASRIDFVDTKTSQEQASNAIKSSILSRKYLHIYDEKISHFISKRAATPTSRACSLHVVADHIFFENIGGSSLSKTISEMRYQVSQADMIFRSTDFNGNGYGDNIGFEISNITVFTDPNYGGYYMSDLSLDVNDYLSTFSKYDFDQSCLAVAFTYRDFDRGVVGLAWMGSSSLFGYPGGLCQRRIQSNGVMYSYNTALVTMLNYGTRLNSYKSSMVLTHEFGHNFGSSHDSDGDPSCVSDTYGNFIMYPTASEGTKPNENKFSPCSINMIYPVIVNKGWCLDDRSTPSCGNSIVEPGEECDCGTSFTCVYTDNCCTPSDVTNSPDAPCTFRRSEGKVCSPRTGLCCENSCTITPTSVQKVCGVSSECQETVICDGNNSVCPNAILKPDNTSCDSDRKLCYNGTCSKSSCERNNLIECQCTTVSHDTCKLCCKAPNTGDCKPATEFSILSTSGDVIMLASGSSCGEFTGFCDSRHTCISEDSNDVIDRLKDAFSSQVRQDIGLWMKNNWYYVFFGLLSLFMLIVVFIGCRRKNENVQGRAYRQGRFEQVMAQARIEREKQERKMNVLAAMFDKRIRKVQHGQESLEYTYAVVRLSVFFPTATKEVIRQSLAKCTSEDVAVRHLLVSGFPMRKMVCAKDFMIS